MKAIIFPKYGSPDVLQLTEMEKPAPKGNEVLIRIHAASANPLDWHRMRGEPFLVHLSEGFFRPKNPMLGADIAGTVEAVGGEVTLFKPGDEVIASIEAGGFAEYACAREDLVTIKPANVSFEAAAATPIVGYTALQGLRDTGKIEAGQKVLVNGASGGVGTFAVQIAKYYGAEVTGVCSARNHDMVRSIGADHVIDYTTEDFTRTGQHYDLIYCAMGNRTASAYRRALVPGGRCVVAGFTTLTHMIVQVVILGSLLSRLSSKEVGMMGVATPNKDDLDFIAQLLESEKIVPVIDRCYPLSETAEALAYLEKGHARGKVIVTMAENHTN